MDIMNKRIHSAFLSNRCGGAFSGLSQRNKTGFSKPHRKRRFRVGFTLIEVIVVMAIIGILAAVAVPSMIGFIEHGKQVNRTNIARTLYLAAQNQMIKSSIEKNMKSTMTGHYFVKNATSGIYTDTLAANSPNNIKSKLPANVFSMSEQTAVEKDYIRYISKPRGPLLAAADDELIGFYNLLNEIIIDKSILNEAILMEYNIMTGVVLSIFYGDDGQGSFGYEAANPKENISGDRGANGGYSHAAQRHQGYYGVESTGELPPPNLQDIVNIYDGKTKALGGMENILYVEMILPKPTGTGTAMPTYDFEIINSESESIINCTMDHLDFDSVPKYFSEALAKIAFNKEAIYRDDVNPIKDVQYGIEIDLSASHYRYIWIIDYIDGDILTKQPYSIDRYADVDGNKITPQDVRALVSRGTGAGVKSFTQANTHFNSELSGGAYEIKTARHLNNIRYKTNGKYKQTCDIDMQLSGNGITNFAPIEDFNGEYYAMKTSNTQYRIDNLKINATGTGENVGLFANIKSAANIQGVSLYRATIHSTNGKNVGGIVGLMEGGRIRQCNSYANITVGSNAIANVGGLVGRIANGMLDQSFNAGFYNAPVKSATSDGVGSVTANRGNIGGLVGLNYGTIQNSFNNARVNIQNVSVTRDGEMLSYDSIPTKPDGKASVGGIVGYNNGGTVQNTYTTNNISLSDDHESTNGAIIGHDSNGRNHQYNYFLSNNTTGSIGETVSKDQLKKNPCGFMFAKATPASQDNSYKNYPYPTLRNNNPFTEDITWGWENIEDVRITDTGLLYYELYNDNTIGFSGGGLTGLVPSGNSDLVLHDGYVLEIEYDSAGTLNLEVTIGASTYTLMITTSPTSCEWKDGSGNIVPATPSIVKHTDSENKIKYLLFFTNEFIENHATSEAYIDFVVKNGADTIITTKFNPLFANTVGRTGTIFSVRSPRHFDNINKALGVKFSQGLNLDFDIYRKTAAFTSTTTGTVTGNRLTYAYNTAIINNANNTTNPFTGEYNGNNFYSKVVTENSVHKGLFANIGTAGAVRSIWLKESTIGQNNIVGGIAAVNNGTIDSCVASEVKINGTLDLGIIAGVNNGIIQNTHVENSIINDTNGENHGGIAGINRPAGQIKNCTVGGSTTISGTKKVGGITGDNGGSINGSSVESITVSGLHDSIGGIAGINSSAISGCAVTSVTVKNTTAGRNVGGIAGENLSSGTITGSAVESSTISAIHDNAGGIAGHNAGFVLASGASFTTVSSTDGNNAGGIAGENGSGGKVEDVFFLSIKKIDEIPITAMTNAGGIVGYNAGNGTESIINTIYLAPAPNTKTGNATTIYPIVGSGAAITNDTNFYLEGYRYSLDVGKNWINTYYNLTYGSNPDERVVLGGGGRGMVTKFIAKEWIEFAYTIALDKWYQPTNGYPYPVPVGIEAPGQWPMTDSPTRPEQEDRLESEWKETESTSDRGRDVTFINGNFADTLLNTADQGMGGTIRAYMFMDYINGWSTRPVGNSNPGTIQESNNNYWIELQDPAGTSSITGINGMYNNYMASNYQGNYSSPSVNVKTSTYRYVELNADVQGTLYQLCATTPGAEFYYSFHHASRATAANVTDQMNFYLTGVGPNDNFANDNALTLIRPCWSPRERMHSNYNTTAKTGADWGKTSLRWNPDARNTVKYDTLGSGSTRINAGDLSYHADKFTNWPSSDTRIYLYDVWIGNTTDSTSQNSTPGYGITFWSTRDLSLASRGYTTLSGLISAAPEANTNVIGYWGISYGWKHYYGLYEVPEGQTRTEFAYQSRTANPTNGNYLDGISFKSPAFLSIDQYIKDQSGENAKFVTLDDVLTVELNIASFGEVLADNIQIVNKLHPYDEYIDYVANSVEVKKGTTNGTNTTPITNNTLTPPAVGNNQTLTVTLPKNVTLAAGETLTITFQIQVRQKVKTVPALETLLFYFKNQAEVTYHDDKTDNGNHFDGYIENVKTNASEILQVYIDPIKLTKTVTPGIDGDPFIVNLSVRDTTGAGSKITTKGLITDLIPAGFTVTQSPLSATLTPNTDGSTRITIPDVNLGDEIKELDYTYALKYTGDGYGVVYTSVSADYKYQYIDLDKGYNFDVMLDFPKPIVGIKVKTRDDIFMLGNGTASRILNITENDNFAKALADANYDVTPEVVLLAKNADQTLITNGDGNLQMDTPYYKAIVIKGTNRLEFTPKAGASGSYELAYQINLTATKTGSPPFELSSEETKITINIVGNSLVYYEKYNDDTYGFYAGENVSVRQELNNSHPIVECGYGALSALKEGSIALGGVTSTIPAVDCNGMYLYKLDTTPVGDFNLQTVRFGTAGSMSEIGKIHPNFAKAVYPTTATSEGNTFRIRTPQQMQNIGVVNGTNKTFTQERDLDFDNIDLNADGAIVQGTFKGTFQGTVDETRFVIKNVTIDAPTTDNVGLFSQNEGIINGVTLKPNTSIKGQNNVGGIVGHNVGVVDGSTQIGGIIEGCIVEGTEDTGNPGSYIGMHIEGYDNVGGMAGLNDGTITDCTVQNTTNTIKGHDFVGGIAGLNGATGMISGAAVSKVRLEADGVNIGIYNGLAGGNDNTDESVDGTASEVTIPETEPEEPVAPAAHQTGNRDTLPQTLLPVRTFGEIKERK